MKMHRTKADWIGLDWIGSDQDQGIQKVINAAVENSSLCLESDRCLPILTEATIK